MAPEHFANAQKNQKNRPKQEHAIGGDYSQRAQ